MLAEECTGAPLTDSAAAPAEKTMPRVKLQPSPAQNRLPVSGLALKA